MKGGGVKQRPIRSGDPILGRILVVDDEPALVEALTYSLRRERYEVATAVSGTEALARARAEQPDLVVLDIMLPGLDGLQVCRALRAESSVPILLLSAKGEEVDRVIGLEIGADDYLTKPFAMRELLARVRAMLRRSQMTIGVPATPAANDTDRTGRPPFASLAGADPVVASGELRIDPARRRASLAERVLTLKPKEFDLLYHLARHPGIVLTRDALLRRVWGYDFPMDTRTVDVHVRWLRTKIESDPSQPRLIETVRGLGYRFVSEAESEREPA